MEFLGIDSGNHEVKVISSRGTDNFPSAIGEWRQRRFGDTHTKNDMDFHIINKYDSYKGFAGPLAAIESEYGGSIFGTSKNHLDSSTRILLAIHRNILGSTVSIVVGQPYKGHNDEEKAEIIRALQGEHKVTINGVTKSFTVEDVKVGIEGAMAFLASPTPGEVNVIDIGSGTVNCIHFLNRRIVDRKCDTLPFGCETSKSGKNIEAMSAGIYRQMSGVWNKNDTTLICGGAANVMLDPLKKYYPNATILLPKIDINGIQMQVDTKFSNAIGMFNIGRKVYGSIQVN